MEGRDHFMENFYLIFNQFRLKSNLTQILTPKLTPNLTQP